MKEILKGAAIGVGVGATALTIFHAVSDHPLDGASALTGFCAAIVQLWLIKELRL